MCNKRNDDQAEDVRNRVNGAPSDLHASNARYHDNCKKRFLNPKSITSTPKQTFSQDATVEILISKLRNEPGRTWSSV